MAHSNGGLVARSYMQKQNCPLNSSYKCGGRVVKLLTFETPHQGGNLTGISDKQIYSAIGYLDYAIKSDLQQNGSFINSIDDVTAGPGFFYKIKTFYIANAFYAPWKWDIAVPGDSARFTMGGDSITRIGPFVCDGTFISAHSALLRNACYLGKSLSSNTAGTTVMAELPINSFSWIQDVLESGVILDGWANLQFCASGNCYGSNLQNLNTRSSHANILAAQDLSPAITWRWDLVDDADTYKIADSSGNIISDILPAGTTTWIEPGLSVNTTYKRKLLVYDNSGLLSASLPTERSTIALPPDIESVGVTALTRIRVSWQNPGNPGDTSYRVDVSTITAIATNIVGYDFVGDTPVEIKGLVPGVTYYVRVDGVNRDGFSAQAVNYSTVSMPSMPKAFALSSVNTSGARYFAADLITSIYLDSAPVYGATLYISTDPLSAPVEITPADMAFANTELNNKYSGSLDTMREFVIYNGSSTYESELTGSITIPYNDDDDDGIVDGTSPEVKVSELSPYTWHNGRWTEVDGPLFRDVANHTITFSITHLSIYSLSGPSTIQAQPVLNNTRVYPIPWQPNSNGRFGSATVAGCGSGLIFDNLTSEGTIQIYNIPGDLVREIAFTAADNGCKAWDGKNAVGRNVASGVYIAVIKNKGSGGGRSIKKLAIER